MITYAAFSCITQLRWMDMAVIVIGWVVLQDGPITHIGLPVVPVQVSTCEPPVYVPPAMVTILPAASVVGYVQRGLFG